VRIADVVGVSEGIRNVFREYTQEFCRPPPVRDPNVAQVSMRFINWAATLHPDEHRGARHLRPVAQPHETRGDVRLMRMPVRTQIDLV